MKILVTGSEGFIGSYVMRLIPDAVGYDVKNNIEDNILDTKHLIEVLKKNNIDVIIHLAALVSIPDSQIHQKAYIENNVKGTMSVIEAALVAGVKRIVYASSSASYEPASSIYAFTKYAPELLFEHYKDKIESICLRFFNVYGKGSNPSYARVIDEFIKGVNDGTGITIFGDGKQTRDFVYVGDIAKGIVAVATSVLRFDNVLDFGTGKSVSVNELALLVCKLMGKFVKINYAPPRVEVKHSKASYAMDSIVFIGKPLTSLEKGLEKLLRDL